MYVSHSEGANFWLSVLTDLQNRGVKDILIACVDGLTGFPDAIQSVFPKTDVQLCIVHQIRNSVKYVASKNQKEFLKDLKMVYAAQTKEKAEIELDNLEKSGASNILSSSSRGVTSGITSHTILTIRNQSDVLCILPTL